MRRAGIPFHFGTGATTLIHQLPRPLRALRRRYPRMTMQITITATEEMRTGLFDRRYDLALITMPCPQASLKITPLYDEELLIVRPSNKAVRGWSAGAILAAELERASFLLHSTRSNMRAIVENAFTEIGVQPRIIMEAEVMRRLVESGFGYSVLPESALRRQPRYFHFFSQSAPQDRAPAGSGHPA